VPTLRLCVLYGSQNKQQLLPYKTLTDWLLYPKWRVFTARYALSPYIKQIRFVFKGLMWAGIWRPLCRLLINTESVPHRGRVRVRYKVHRLILLAEEMGFYCTIRNVDKSCARVKKFWCYIQWPRGFKGLERQHTFSEGFCTYWEPL
jgi:hypothetical protein